MIVKQWINFEQSFNQRLNSQHLDEQQTKAKNFSLKGHALVRGVAGSGKSLVLRNRIEKLIEAGYNDILVLCYNRFMKDWIDSIIAQKGLSLNVECRTFHSWAYRIGYDYNWDEIPEMRSQIIDLVKNKAKHRYQAILIDEAQDFYDEWFEAMLYAVDPDTNSIFFVYDNTQSVYGQQHRRKEDWKWKDIGFNVTGRSQIFELNYRNAPEILELAWQFIIPYLANADMKTAKKQPKKTIPIGHIVEPVKKFSRSSSLKPMLLKSDMSPDNIAKQVKLALRSHPESSIGVLLHPQESEYFKLEISKYLGQLNVVHHAPRFSRDRKYNVVNRPFVIVDSWNALKGVEFDAVIIAGVDKVKDLPDPDKDFSEKAGLYTAITRARDHVVMLYQDETQVVQQLQKILTAPDVLESDSRVSDKAA